jgi:hypothetical protein
MMAVSVALSMFSLLAGRVMAAPNTFFIQSTILPSGVGVNPLDAAPPAFDLQMGLTFVDNFSSIRYNVTVNRQMDEDEYGPGYEVNGLSNTGYWYQAGYAWDWPFSGGGYSYGFKFLYQVYNSQGQPIFPVGGGGISSFSGSVNVGDRMCLGLSFSSGNVTMSASDLETGAYASQSYFGYKAGEFIGNPSGFCNAPGQFTGLMTEWYHASKFFCNEEQVSYLDNSSATPSGAWMWWNYFDLNQNKHVCDYALCQYTSQPNELQEFSYMNTTEYSDAYELQTGALVLCALKTMETTGLFYVPNPTYVNATCLRVEMVFADASLTGDQAGAGLSPYPAVADYPDGKVDGRDITLISKAFGTSEGQSGWNYMADVYPDRKINGEDITQAAKNFGQNGTYIYYIFGFNIEFNTGAWYEPDATGFVPIPPGATSFNVTDLNGYPIGAMILFCGS